MSVVKMHTERAQELASRYFLAATQIDLLKQRVTQPFVEYNSLTTNLGNSHPTDLVVNPQTYLEVLDDIVLWLNLDGKDLEWRLNWMVRSDLELDNYSFIPTLRLADHSTHSLLTRLKNLNLSDRNELLGQDLGDLLSELARRTLDDPRLANQILTKLGAPTLELILERIYIDLGRWVNTDVEISSIRQQQALHLLPLSILFANASRDKNGMNPVIEKIFFPITPSRDGSRNESRNSSGNESEKSKKDPKLNFRYLGMILGTAKFAPSFLSSASIFALNKLNRQTILSALSNNPLELPGKRPKNQPLAKLLNPGRSALEQIANTPDGYLELFANPRLAGLLLDTDTLLQHRVEYMEVFNNGILLLAESAVESPEILDELGPALPTLGAFIYRNQSHLAEFQNFYVSTAKLLSLFIPDLRSMATEVTAPLLAPIMADPEAMVILSGSVGVFALRHLQQALEVEFSSTLKQGEKQRLISAHSDAVSDIYHHIFSAISVNESNIDESMSLVSNALGFGAKHLMNIATSNASLHQQLAISSTIFASKKIKNLIFEDASTSKDLNRGLTPRELFTKQILNRDFTAGPGSVYPEPTWFELELATRVLQQSPEARKDLEVGRWFNGKTITPPSGAAQVGHDISTNNTPATNNVDNIFGLINANNNSLQNFSGWFAKSVNADPPTNFSSSYLHIQKEFTRDLLIDALSIEVDTAIREARAAKAAANLALESYYEDNGNY